KASTCAGRFLPPFVALGNSREGKPPMIRALLAAFSLTALLAGAAAADDCSYCNTLSNVAACCRPKAGCQTRAQEGHNVCVATARSHEPAHNGFTPAQCKKNYNTCIKSVRGSSARVRGA